MTIFHAPVALPYLPLAPYVINCNAYKHLSWHVPYIYSNTAVSFYDLDLYILAKCLYLFWRQLYCLAPCLISCMSYSYRAWHTLPRQGKAVRCHYLTKAYVSQSKYCVIFCNPNPAFNSISN